MADNPCLARQLVFRTIRLKSTEYEVRRMEAEAHLDDAFSAFIHDNSYSELSSI